MQVFILSAHGIVLVGDDEMLESLPIRVIVVEYALCALPISTCSTTFLSIVLQRLGNGCVHDEPDILFVDAHTEGNGGNDDVDFVSHPPQLNIFTSLISHLSMVIVAVNLELRKLGTEFLALFPCQAVDDT